MYNVGLFALIALDLDWLTGQPQLHQSEDRKRDWVRQKDKEWVHLSLSHTHAHTHAHTYTHTPGLGQLQDNGNRL